jgi:DNA-binding IclR family transcriptional regulator
VTRPTGNAQRNPYVVQPVFRALKVLEYVARQGHDVTLTEVASELSLPKTTAFRYLQTLTVATFLSHDRAHDRYGLGSRFHALANADTSLRRLRDVAHPLMEDIGRSFNETVNLGILADRHIVYVEIIEANRALRMQARIGDRHPVHSTSLGKAILAFLPDDESKALLDGSLRERTFKTVTNRTTLRRQIGEAQRRGYAIEIGENEDGSMCIGVPILDGAGRPLAAISLAAPERRMTPTVIERATAALIEAAGRISARLGASVPRVARGHSDGAIG